VNISVIVRFCPAVAGSRVGVVVKVLPSFAEQVGMVVSRIVLGEHIDSAQALETNEVMVAGVRFLWGLEVEDVVGA